MAILRSVTILVVTLFALSGCLEKATQTIVAPPAPPGGGTGGTGTTTGTGTAGGPLTITAPADLAAEANAPLSTLSLGTATANGGSGNYTIVSDAPAAGFPLGATTVTWTATDTAGASMTAVQQVTVSDTTPPSISGVLPVEEVTTGTLTAVTVNPPTITDLYDPTPLLSDNLPAAGFPLGTTVVTWTATDVNGNSATANQDVTILATAPGLTGAELYAMHCAGCHGPLATSTRRGRTATQITNALATVPDMAGITLTPAEITLIAEALADTTSGLVNVSLSSSTVSLDLRKTASITATIEAVGTFSGPVDVSLQGMNPETGSYVIEPSSTANVPAGGSVDVTIRFTTTVSSLSVNAQALSLNIRDQATQTDVDGGSIDYTVNNFLEIQFDQNSGTNNATHRWNGQRGGNLTLRPNTRAIWTNYDTTATHIVHGNGAIPHGPTGNALDSPAVPGQRGESYGANGVGRYDQGQVTPMVLTGGSFYCHTHNNGGSEISVVIDNTLSAHP